MKKSKLFALVLSGALLLGLLAGCSGGTKNPGSSGRSEERRVGKECL